MIILPNSIIRSPKTSSNDLRFLVICLKHGQMTDEGSVSFSGYRHIKRLSDLDDRKIARSIANWISKGVLAVSKVPSQSGFESNHYRFKPWEQWTDLQPNTTNGFVCVPWEVVLNPNVASDLLRLTLLFVSLPRTDPTLKQITNYTGWGKSRILRVLSKMEELKILTITRSQGRVRNSYELQAGWALLLQNLGISNGPKSHALTVLNRGHKHTELKHNYLSIKADAPEGSYCEETPGEEISTAAGIHLKESSGPPSTIGEAFKQSILRGVRKAEQLEREIHSAIPRSSRSATDHPAEIRITVGECKMWLAPAFQRGVPNWSEAEFKSYLLKIGLGSTFLNEALVAAYQELAEKAGPPIYPADQLLHQTFRSL